MMNPQLRDKLRSVAGRYEELTRLLSDPAVQSDPASYRKHARELSAVEPLFARHGPVRDADAQLAQAREVAASGDAEMQALAQEEIESLEEELARLEADVRVLLV